MLSNREKTIYLSINGDGKFTQRVEENTPGSKSRVSEKTGKTYHELFFDNFEGFISDVKTENSTYGMQCKIFMVDGEEKVILTMSYSSPVLSQFLKVFPNVDLSKKVLLSTSAKIDDKGKNKISLFVKQDDQLIPYAHKADEPNGMPERELIKVKGNDTWDYTKQIEFLLDQAKKKLHSEDGDEKTFDEKVDELTKEDKPF